MPAKPKLARRSTAVMVFVAGMDDFGKVQKVAHFSRSPRLLTNIRGTAQQDGKGAGLIPEQLAI